MGFLTVVSRRYSIEQCRINFDTLFIFGDNLDRIGMGGQAVIREQKNSIGLATKKKPTMQKEDFFTDAEFDENCQIIDEEIEKIIKFAEEMDFNKIALPQMGLGTGLSDMPRKCPKTFCYLTMKLIDVFQFNNVQFLQSK